jgi:hypothetical protein
MKTKVVAFRVTQEEYDALALRVEWCKRSESQQHIRSVSDLVNDLIRGELDGMLYGLAKERKRIEAKAKRDAKKAAANAE